MMRRGFFSRGRSFPLEAIPKAARMGWCWCRRHWGRVSVSRSGYGGERVKSKIKIPLSRVLGLIRSMKRWRIQRARLGHIDHLVFKAISQLSVFNRREK